MKSDPHLYPAEAPIIEGQSYFALCGKTVHRSRFVMMWDAISLGVPLRLLTMRCCRKCLEALGDPSNEIRVRRRYLYGIVDAGIVEEGEEAA